MNDPLIRLSQIRFGYEPGKWVLDRLDLELLPGQRLGLAGATGGGKTTILHLIVGLLRPVSGSVEVFDRPCSTETDFFQVRKRVQLLFQDAEDQLFSPSVIEDVSFGPLNLGKSREEALEAAHTALDALGLHGYEERITHRLSGGEKRLVSLAAVMAMQPDVLLLDEPDSGLDENTLDRLTNILIHLPIAMIIVSHHRDFLSRTATDGMTLRDGRLSPW